MSYPPKLRQYNTGRTVFIKYGDQVLQRHVFDIDNKLCVILNKSLFKLGKQTHHKIEQTTYYSVSLYKKIDRI